MVLTDSIQSHILAIEPESCLCIETEVTESRQRLVGINSFSIDHHFRQKLISMGICW